MLQSVRILSELGFELYASKGTADFYSRKKIKVFCFKFFSQPCIACLIFIILLYNLNACFKLL